MTHLHTDHAGGLYHFPRSEILVSRQAYPLGTGFAGQLRGFLPQRWPAWFDPTLFDLAPRPWRTFLASLSLTKDEDKYLSEKSEGMWLLVRAMHAPTTTKILFAKGLNVEQWQMRTLESA